MVFETIEFKNWCKNRDDNSLSLFAKARTNGVKELRAFINDSIHENVDEIWVAIGPEGGWTPEEESQSEKYGWEPISFGSSILRTSTAAVSASNAMAMWRDNNPLDS